MAALDRADADAVLEQPKPILLNIVAAFAANPATTATQLAALKVLDAKMDADFDDAITAYLASHPDPATAPPFVIGRLTTGPAHLQGVFSMFNSNLVHNLINVVIILVSAITAGLSAWGCTSLPTGAIDCSASTIPPQYSGALIALLGVLKMLINISRDGLAGLTKPQPPADKAQ